MKESERGRSKGRVTDEGEEKGGMVRKGWRGKWQERVRKRTRSKGNIASGLDAN